MRGKREILDLIADGCTNRQIGARLFLAEKTVMSYGSGRSPSSACSGGHRRPCTEQPCASRPAGSLRKAAKNRPGGVTSDLRPSILHQLRNRLDVRAGIGDVITDLSQARCTYVLNLDA